MPVTALFRNRYNLREHTLTTGFRASSGTNDPQTKVSGLDAKPKIAKGKGDRVFSGSRRLKSEDIEHKRTDSLH